ncbi:MAG: hypothetical protein EZS28_006086 [Streblomastix strix]|uniref:Uncharacterized protein n=1 Tax=Streblomastix strix TaxID=222440 RepID=A0A5J4WTK4_9EUKA|nr:MAG: hypothetical protein EZS28_006086 [Streblomastix strix]
MALQQDKIPHSSKTCRININKQDGTTSNKNRSARGMVNTCRCRNLDIRSMIIGRRCPNIKSNEWRARLGRGAKARWILILSKMTKIKQSKAIRKPIMKLINEQICKEHKVNRTLCGYWSRQMDIDRSRTCVDRLIEADETVEYAWRMRQSEIIAERGQIQRAIGCGAGVGYREGSIGISDYTHQSNMHSPKGRWEMEESA